MSRFSFGKSKDQDSASTTNASTTAASTTNASTTDNKSSTGSKYNFSFNKKDSTSSNNAKSSDQPVNIPPELKNKKVKEVIEIMESQLEQQARQFQTQARQIARWDRIIYEIIDLMIFLENQIKNIENTQKELSASANSLLQEQVSFLKTLKENTSSSQSDDSLATSDQRAKLYLTARRLGEEFNLMEYQLKKIVEKTESKESQGSTSEIDKVVQISNCQLESLQWISNQCASIEEKLDAIESHI